MADPDRLADPLGWEWVDPIAVLAKVQKLSEEELALGLLLRFLTPGAAYPSLSLVILLEGFRRDYYEGLL